MMKSCDRCGGKGTIENGLGDDIDCPECVGEGNLPNCPDCENPVVSSYGLAAPRQWLCRECRTLVDNEAAVTG